MGRVAGPRTSKSSFPPEDADSMILRGYCGAKKSYGPAHFVPGPKAQAKEAPEIREGKEEAQALTERAEDDPISGRPRT